MKKDLFCKEEVYNIVGAAIEVHKELGPGFLESVYEEALCYELSKAGLEFKRQQSVPEKNHQNKFQES